MDYKISVDSILAELKILDGQKAPTQKVYTMDMIDDIVRNILTKKQEEQLLRENRAANINDIEELEKEIKHQTRSLTKEFEKLNKIANKFPKIPDLLPLPSLDGAIKIAQQNLHKERIKSFTSQFSTDMEASAQNAKKILREHEIIFTNNHESQSKRANTNISLESFIELKQNRNAKMDDFILEPAKRNEPSESVKDNLEEPHKHIDKSKKETYKTNDISSDDLEYENVNQKNQILDYLKKGFGVISNQLALLFGISIVSIMLSFFAIDSSNIVVIGVLNMTPLLYGYINLFLLIISILCSLSIFTNTVKAMLKQKPSRDLLFIIAFLFVLATNIVAIVYPQQLLASNIYIYTPVFIISLFFLRLSYYQKQKVVISNFDMLINNTDIYSLDFVDNPSIANEFVKGFNCDDPIIAKNIKTNFVDRFMEHSFEDDYNDKLLGMVAFLAFPIGILILGIVFLVSNNIFTGISIASSIMVLTTGFMSSIIVSFPLVDISKMAIKKRFLVPTNMSIMETKDINSVFIDGSKLFPEGSIILHSIKSFQGQPIDKAILYSASITHHMDSSLKPVFVNMLSNKEMIIPVEDFKYEDAMGVSAFIDNNTVLIGNRELMINHSVAIPPKSYEKNFDKDNYHMIYLATNGELCAAFILEFCASEKADHMFYYLNKYNINAIIHTCDFFIQPVLIADLFGVDKAFLKIIPARMHNEFREQMKNQDRMPFIGVNNGNDFSFILSIISAKKLHKCFKFYTGMYILSVFIGILFTCIGIFEIGFSGVTPSMLLIYLSMFLGLFWIYQKRSNL